MQRVVFLGKDGGNMGRILLKENNTWGCLCTPVIPATWEAEGRKITSSRLASAISKILPQNIITMAGDGALCQNAGLVYVRFSVPTLVLQKERKL